MNPMLRTTTIVALLACAAPWSCAAPSAHKVQETPGAIVVLVRRHDAGFVPDTGVRVQDASGTVVGVQRTNSCGAAVFEPLPDGVYLVRAESGEADPVAEQISVSRGKDSLVNLTLATSSLPAGVSSKSCTPPTFVSGPSPIYTSASLTRNVQGCLVIKCVITAQGRVRRCEPLEPLDGLTGPALSALEQRRYTPMTCDGKPIDTDYTYRINFRLPR